MGAVRPNEKPFPAATMSVFERNFLSDVSYPAVAGTRWGTRDALKHSTISLPSY